MKPSGAQRLNLRKTSAFFLTHLEFSTHFLTAENNNTQECSRLRATLSKTQESPDASGNLARVIWIDEVSNGDPFPGSASRDSHASKKPRLCARGRTFSSARHQRDHHHLQRH